MDNFTRSSDSIQSENEHEKTLEENATVTKPDSGFHKGFSTFVENTQTPDNLCRSRTRISTPNPKHIFV